MRPNKDIERLAAEAEREQRCLLPENEAQFKLILARMRSGEIIRTHRGIYARSDYWNTLLPPERARHIVRAISLRHPDRIFAGISAAAMLFLEHQWDLHDDGLVFLASRSGGSVAAYRGIRHIVMSDIPVNTLIRYRHGSAAPQQTLIADRLSGRDPQRFVPRNATVIAAVAITSPARILVDCGLRYRFEQALPIFDSALRQRLVTRDQVMEICDSLHADCGTVNRLLHYANPRNENGGESLCYATIIDQGFAVPQLQHEFIDPLDMRNRYRVDFVWHTPDGRVIVLEYDGMRKYVDPSMTGGGSVRDVVRREREREDALRRAKVTTILRTNHDEVTRRYPLIRKLIDAEVPMRVMNSYYEEAS